MKTNTLVLTLLGVVVATELAVAAVPDGYNNTILTQLVAPLEREIATQKQLQRYADSVSQSYKIFKDRESLAGEDVDHHASLVGNVDALIKRLTELEILMAAPYVELNDFPKRGFAESKFFIMGTVVKNTLRSGKASIENQQDYVIDLDLPQYLPDQQSLDFAFVAYGKKIDEGGLASEQLLYLPIREEEYKSTVNTYHGVRRDIAAHYYYGTIIPGCKYDEIFKKIDDRIRSDIAYLFKIHGFKAFYESAHPGVTPPTPDITPPVEPPVEPPVVPPSPPLPPSPVSQSSSATNLIRGIVILLLVSAIAVVLILALRPKCKQCGAPLAHGKCTNPHCKSMERHCPHCGSVLDAFGKCQNSNCPSNQRHCPDCGGVLDASGNCPNASCPSKRGRCPTCGAPLNEKGECDECTKVPMGPAKLVNLEPDATRTYSRYALKVISPSEWANRVITGFPPAFEVGRNSTKTPQGIPYLLLNMDGNPRQNECSRRYVRIKDTEGGLSVDLLAENNTCVVDGKDLRAKGECAVAKLDAVIELRPDWKFRVITSDAR